MRNPWLNLPKSSPYVLGDDKRRIDAFNERLRASSRCRVHVEDVIPEPFVGAVMTAPVLILQLNPGINPNPATIRLHTDPTYRAALLANLSHEESDWPFYFFDPRFQESHPGGEWWTKRTRQLANFVPHERLARRLAVVEWFPYRSPRFRQGCESLPSQTYGFHLVESAIARDALIVVSRNVGPWEKSVPSLLQYKRKLTLSSPQAAYFTANNLKHNGVKSPKAWQMLVEALS